MRKTCKKPSRNLQKVDKIVGRFEMSPSRQPLLHKALWDMEDDMLNNLTTADTTGLAILSHYSLFTRLYSDKCMWLEYSNYLYNVYELRSVNAYIGMRKLEYIIDVYYEIIIKLEDLLLNYYRESLNTPERNIPKTKLRNVCAWFVFHVNRLSKYDIEGLRFSYGRDYYTDFQKDTLKDLVISGSVVRRLVDMLVLDKGCVLYKGYNMNNENNEGKSAMSLLLLPKNLINEFSDERSIGDGILNKTNNVNVKPIIEVRKESGSKEVIDECDYEDDWRPEIERTVKVLTTCMRNFNKSVIKIGKYEIPEYFIRRIWIKDVNTYGRIHDDGGIQTKSSYLRQQIIIDGESVVTVDLSALHPRLLYNMKGIDVGEDFEPYPDLDIKLDNRRINKFKKFYNIEKYNPTRNLAKVVLLVMINSKSKTEAVSAIRKKLNIDNSKLQTRREQDMSFVGIPNDINLYDIMTQIENHNEGIKEFFYSDISLKLMNYDSNILIEAIECLCELDIVCLPVHDSLTVRKSYKDECIKALMYGYKKVMGNLINFKYKVE